MAEFPFPPRFSFFLKSSVSKAQYPTHFQWVGGAQRDMRISAYVFPFAAQCVPSGQAGYLQELSGRSAICDLYAISQMDDIRLGIILLYDGEQSRLRLAVGYRPSPCSDGNSRRVEKPSSSPRKRGPISRWIPAFAGMTRVFHELSWAGGP